MKPYFLAPFVGWVVSGTVKFLINSFRFGKKATERIGNGGLPSTHTTIMATTSMWIGLEQGFSAPLFGLAVAVTFIVILDATGLRRHVGMHAARINELTQQPGLSLKNASKLRESMGHTYFEVGGGLALGMVLGLVLYWLY